MAVARIPDGRRHGQEDSLCLGGSPVPSPTVSTEMAGEGGGSLDTASRSKRSQVHGSTRRKVERGLDQCVGPAGPEAILAMQSRKRETEGPHVFTSSQGGGKP